MELIVNFNKLYYKKNRKKLYFCFVYNNNNNSKTSSMGCRALLFVKKNSRERERDGKWKMINRCRNREEFKNVVINKNKTKN